MNKPRILLILHLPPPIHGASMMGEIIRNSKRINQAFDCTYINLSSSENLHDIQKFRFSKIRSVGSIWFSILREILFRRVDLCYLTMSTKGAPFYKDLGFVLLIKLLGKRIVYHFHNKGIKEYQERLVDHLLYKLAFRKSKAILLSPLLYPDIEKYLGREDVYYCPNGIVPQKAPQLPHSKNSGTPCRLLFISNMMVEKGVMELLEACHTLSEEGVEFICDFVGKWYNVDERMFNDFIADARLTDKVFAHGARYGEKKNSFYANADIFVFPTHNDAFPLVLLEAMEHGLPVISTREGAIPEIIEDQKNGLLIPKQSVSDLASKIRFLIENPALREEMGHAGRNKFADNYRSETFELKLEQILGELSLNRENDTS